MTLQTFSLKYHQLKVLRRKQKWHKYHRQKRIRRRKKGKKRGEGKTEEKKNKGDDHNTRKLEESATYRCKFDKDWSKKTPCIQPVKVDPHAFFCTICSKKVSCCHQAIGDVVRHCKTARHIKFKDEMNRQRKIEKTDDLFKKKVSLFEFRLSYDKF